MKLKKVKKTQKENGIDNEFFEFVDLFFERLNGGASQKELENICDQTESIMFESFSEKEKKYYKKTIKEDELWKK